MSPRTVVRLAERRSPDADVVLCWGRLSGRFWVVVTDRHSGHTARINATATDALEVFRRSASADCRDDVDA